MSIQLQNINRQIVLAYKEYDEKVDKSKREPIRERIGHLFEDKRAELCLIELEKERYIVDKFGPRRGPKYDGNTDYMIDRYKKNLIKRDLRK
jgi:hypothetical protein